MCVWVCSTNGTVPPDKLSGAVDGDCQDLVDHVCWPVTVCYIVAAWERHYYYVCGSLLGSCLLCCLLADEALINTVLVVCSGLTQTVRPSDRQTQSDHIGYGGRRRLQLGAWWMCRAASQRPHASCMMHVMV